MIGRTVNPTTKTQTTHARDGAWQVNDKDGKSKMWNRGTRGKSRDGDSKWAEEVRLSVSIPGFASTVCSLSHSENKSAARESNERLTKPSMGGGKDGADQHDGRRGPAQPAREFR
eukprot:3673392-Pyramimonas_sp.AAC.2